MGLERVPGCIGCGRVGSGCVVAGEWGAIEGGRSGGREVGTGACGLGRVGFGRMVVWQRAGQEGWARRVRGDTCARIVIEVRGGRRQQRVAPQPELEGKVL